MNDTQFKVNFLLLLIFKTSSTLTPINILKHLVIVQKKEAEEKNVFHT